MRLDGACTCVKKHEKIGVSSSVSKHVKIGVIRVKNHVKIKISVKSIVD